ncbi:MAG TPA: TonB family protein [Xanthobacteraceae bacterium]
MIAVATEDRRELVRWLICGVVVLFAHGGIAAALIERRAPIEEGEVGTDAIIVEFQPEQIETNPTPPVEKIEDKEEPLPVQQSEAMLQPLPEPLPEPPRQETPAVLPQPSRARADVATWKSQMVSLLEHNKRYPGEARARGEQGVARLAFRIDRDGHLLSSRIVASSGSAALDTETLALVQRTQPFPPPPPELAGAEMTVPLRFSIH